MLIIECSKIKKYYGDRLILDIDNLNIYSEDRIGVVGLNGAGKTTLINILSQRIEPDKGWVKLRGKTEYFSQLEEPEVYESSSEMASKFGVETLINLHYQAQEKKVKYVMLEGLKHPPKFDKGRSKSRAIKKFVGMTSNCFSIV